MVTASAMLLVPLSIAEGLSICARAVPRPDLLVHQNGAFRIYTPTAPHSDVATRDEVREVRYKRDATPTRTRHEGMQSVERIAASEEDWNIVAHPSGRGSQPTRSNGRCVLA